MTKIFASQSEFEGAIPYFDSLMRVSLFEVSCECINSLEMRHYLIKRKEADKMFEEMPVIMDGGGEITGTSFKLFDLLKASCLYKGLNYNDRFEKLIKALDNKLKVDDLGIQERDLIWQTIDSITITQLLEKAIEYKNNKEIFHQLFLDLIRKRGEMESVVENFKFLLMNTRDALDVYEIQILILAACRITPKIRSKLYPVLNQERKYIAQNIQIPTENKNKLIHWIENMEYENTHGINNQLWKDYKSK